MENKKICAVCESHIEKEPVMMPALVYGDDYVYVCYTNDLKCVTAYRNQMEKSRAPGVNEKKDNPFVNEANLALASGFSFTLRQGTKTSEVSRFATGGDGEAIALTPDGWFTVGDDDGVSMVPLPMVEPKKAARGQ